MDRTAVQNGAADLVALLEHGDFVSPERSDPRGFQTGRSAAYNRDIELLVGRTEVDEPLVAHRRVDGAAHVVFDHQGFLPAADQAGDTLTDLFRFAGCGLVGPVGIGDHLAGESDHVGFAFRKDLLAVVGVPQCVAGDDRDLHMFLDLFSGVGVPPLRVVHRVHGGPGHLENTGADIEKGYSVLLEQLGRFGALLEPAAALDPLLAGVTDADGEVRTALVLDGVNDLQGETHAAGEAAAEAVVSLVHIRAHELSDQVAVGAVQLHRVETGLLKPPGAFGELVDQVVDLFDGHSPYALALGFRRGIDDLVTGGGGDVRHLIRGRDQVLARPGSLPPRMLDLHSGLGSMAGHGFGQLGKTGDQRVFVHGDTGHRRLAGFLIRRGSPADNEAAAAFGDLFMVGDDPLVDRTIGVCRRDICRHVTDPVRHFEVPDSDRAE